MKRVFQHLTLARQCLRRCSSTYPSPNLKLPSPCPDWRYLLNPGHRDAIAQNVASRKGIGDIDLVYKLHAEKNERPDDILAEQALLEEVLKIPNRTHPDVVSYGETPVVRKNTKWKPKFELNKVRTFEEIADTVHGVRLKNVNYFR